MDQRERRSLCEKVDVCDLILNVADDIKEQFLPLYTYDIDMWYLMTRLTYGIGAYASKASDLQEFATGADPAVKFDRCSKMGVVQGPHPLSELE